MTEEEPLSSLDDLDARLQGLKTKEAERQARQASHQVAGPSMGVAMRIAVEMISALAVTGVIGWFLDQWLNTRPWLMLVMLLLGSVVGLLNTYRGAMRMHRKMEVEDESFREEES